MKLLAIIQLTVRESLAKKPLSRFWEFPRLSACCFYLP